MTLLAKNFINFLLKKAEEEGKQGRLYFPEFEYSLFHGHEAAINELIRGGYLKKTGDIADGIVITDIGKEIK